jgi:uncharacterized protein YecE (DUF72 family)
MRASKFVILSPPLLKKNSSLISRFELSRRRSNTVFTATETKNPMQESPLTVTTDFAYVRLHGPGTRKYRDSYDEAHLRRWRDQIADWARTLKAIYAYFDNDQLGFAAHNALTLQKMLRAVSL